MPSDQQFHLNPAMKAVSRIVLEFFSTSHCLVALHYPTFLT